ncbi:hypothetical protein [Salinisphaera shabanensis]|jgi:hypothetical protein|uniref:hypothetical protein n=1 Tax=Salinisphaera shabanensis TaxID=180542 RepID=UPI00334037C2
MSECNHDHHRPHPHTHGPECDHTFFGCKQAGYVDRILSHGRQTGTKIARAGYPARQDDGLPPFPDFPSLLFSSRNTLQKQNQRAAT